MFDIVQSHAKVEAVLAAGGSFEAGMALLFDFCAEHEPNCTGQRGHSDFPLRQTKTTFY